jgi:hypothetical protein
LYIYTILSAKPDVSPAPQKKSSSAEVSPEHGKKQKLLLKRYKQHDTGGYQRRALNN